MASIAIIAIIAIMAMIAMIAIIAIAAIIAIIAIISSGPPAPRHRPAHQLGAALQGLGARCVYIYIYICIETEI